MVELYQVFLDRTKGTGLNFGIQGSSWKGYFIQKYHIFDPVTGFVIINNITFIKEKTHEEIESLYLGSECQSIDFMTNIPNCSLIKKRKKIFKTEDIFYIPNGLEVVVKNYVNKNRKAYTRDKKLVCEIFLPSTLFDSIEKIKDKITKYPTYKTIENQHLLNYKEYEFTVISNSQQKNLDKNKEFLKDLSGIHCGSKWGEALVTKKLKDNVLRNMKDFINKYETFNVEE